MMGLSFLVLFSSVSNLSLLMPQSYLGTTLATTSLLIIVGAVMQTSRQVGAHSTPNNC